MIKQYGLATLLAENRLPTPTIVVVITARQSKAPQRAHSRKLREDVESWSPLLSPLLVGMPNDSSSNT